MRPFTDVVEQPRLFRRGLQWRSEPIVFLAETILYLRGEEERPHMETLVIHAVSRESAEGFCAAVAEFDPRLVEFESGRYQVEIPLAGVGAKQIVAALSALEAYVTERGDGAASLELGGQPYELHPVDE